MRFENIRYNHNHQLVNWWYPREKKSFHDPFVIKIFYSVLDENISNFESLSDDDEFRAILTSPNEDVIFSHGKFIHDGFESRELFQRNSPWNICNTGFNSSVLVLKLHAHICFFSFLLLF